MPTPTLAMAARRKRSFDCDPYADSCLFHPGFVAQNSRCLFIDPFNE
jgi:hypothetical protein